MRRISLSSSLQVAFFILLASGYYMWTWSSNLRDLGGDSAVYLLTAQYYSPWSAYSSVAADFGRTSLYPPLFPFLLGIADLGGDVAFAHVMTTTFLLMALLCFYVWLRTSGQTPFTAGMSTLVFALLPGTYAQAVSILSENLYLLCTFIAFVAVARYEKNQNLRWLWFAAIGVALSVLTRSAGVALYLAFMVYLFIRRVPQRWQLGIAALLPFVMWQILHGLNQPGYVSSFLQNYTSASRPNFFPQLCNQIVVVGTGWLENFAANPVGIPVATLIGIVCLGGMAWRLYLKQMDGYYALAYLFLITLWPFPAESKRLVFVILPILLAQGMEVITALPAVTLLKHRFRAAIVLYSGSALLIIFPTVVLTVTQFIRGGLGESGYIAVVRAGILPDNRFVLGSETAAVEDNLRKILNQLKESDCIYSIKPSIVAFYTSKKSIAPPPSRVSKDEFNRLTTESGCRFFYVMALVSPSYSESLYPLERLVSHVQFDSVVTLKVGGHERIFSALVERFN